MGDGLRGFERGVNDIVQCHGQLLKPGEDSHDEKEEGERPLMRRKHPI